MSIFRKWLLRRRIRRARALILKIDEMLSAMKAPRWKRRQLWHDFIKRDSGHAAILDILNEAGK